MQLKLLVATLTVLSTLGGCSVHFPLADNGPTLWNSSDSTSTTDMRLAPTEPDNRNPVKGNSADAPD